jgi:hypothetical protein
MVTATRTAMAAALIAGLSSAATGQTINSNPAAGPRMQGSAISEMSAQRVPTRQTRPVALNTNDGQAQVIRAAVGPDNYQNWRQACCL